jgi:hypothetical protein
MPFGQCRGALLVSLRALVTESLDASAWERLCGTLPSSDRDALARPLLASGWYPVGVWNRLLRNHVRSTFDPSAETRRVARRIADSDFNTFLKLALAIATPDTIIARTGTFWSRYFGKTTVMSPQLVRPREWMLTLTGPTGEDDAPSALNCGDGVNGWIEQALTMAGVQAPKVTHQHCRFRGAPDCKTRVVW